MDNKKLTLVIAVAVAFAVGLGVATASFAILKPASPVAESADRGEAPAAEPAKPEKKPVAERRHGPKVKKEVDMTSMFSDWGGAGQDGGDFKELHEQTPEEAVESMWQGLDTYREMSPEDKAKAQVALGLVTVIVSAIGDNIGGLVQDMDEQQRAEAIANAQAALTNINAIEQEVAPDMTPEELNTIGGTLQAVRKLNVNLLNALR